jgi:hypothetical protein
MLDYGQMVVPISLGHNWDCYSGTSGRYDYLWEIQIHPSAHLWETIAKMPVFDSRDFRDF